MPYRRTKKFNKQPFKITLFFSLDKTLAEGGRGLGLESLCQKLDFLKGQFHSNGVHRGEHVVKENNLLIEG